MSTAPAPISLADAEKQTECQVPAVLFRYFLRDFPEAVRLRFLPTQEPAEPLPVMEEHFGMPHAAYQEALATSAVDPEVCDLMQAWWLLGRRILASAPPGEPVALVAGGLDGQIEGSPALGFQLTGPTVEGTQIRWCLSWRGRWMENVTP